MNLKMRSLKKKRTENFSQPHNGQGNIKQNLRQEDSMKIGYARVSRSDQDLSLQTQALTAAGVDQIYSDKISGAEHDRDGLSELLRHARKGDIVIVWRLDRLARSLPHLIELAADFEKRGIQLRSLTENIDTSTAAGKLFFNIFASIAEFERNLIIERTLAGLDAAPAQGKFGGRPPALDKRKKKLIDAAVKDAERKG